MFRQVAGCLFNALPEKWLTEDLYGPISGAEVGMGFDPIAPSTAKPKVTGRYILYVGRKETGKNLHLLVDYFCAAKDAQKIPEDIKLVILGGGSFTDLNRTKAQTRSDIIDLPHLSEEEKKSVIQHALCLCQPSTNESFSIVLMEAWQLQVPVLVHAQGAVTRYHVEQSNGGLYFGSQPEFEAVLMQLADDSSLCEKFGSNGANYVQKNYSWPAVIDRFYAAVDRIRSIGINAAR